MLLFQKIAKLLFNRSDILPFWLGSIVGITMHGCTGNQEATKESSTTCESPNIIWFMAEDMSLDLECYGTKGLQTPNLNRLANEGTRYTNCYCTSPICSPSRSAMMTGVHQNIINAQHHRSYRNSPLPTLYKPITYFLRNAGYTCILGDSLVFDGGTKIDCNFKTSELGPWDGIRNFGLFDKELGFELEDQPFFAQISLKITHRGDWWSEIRAQSPDPVNPDSIFLPPYMANDSIIKLDWARYLDQVEAMDREVGLILEKLEKLGIINNTLIIFIADNGISNIRGKGYLNDPGLHVPLIIRCPGRVPRGAVSDRLISTLDLSASIINIAGIELPEYISAIPFIGLNNAPERKYIYSSRDLWDEVPDQSRSVTTKEYRYIKHYMTNVPFDAHQAYLEFYRPAVHISRKLLRENKLSREQALFFQSYKPAEELYDKLNDPYELKNLATNPDYKNVLAEMRKYLEDWQLRYEDVGLDPIQWEYVEHPAATNVLKWFKIQHPELYQQMLDGKEPGYQNLLNEYRQR